MIVLKCLRADDNERESVCVGGYSWGCGERKFMLLPDCLAVTDFRGSLKRNRLTSLLMVFLRIAVTG